MTKSLIALLFGFISISSFGQTMQTAADNDPAAKKILDKLKAEYDTYESMEVNFELILELPQQVQNTCSTPHRPTNRQHKEAS